MAEPILQLVFQDQILETIKLTRDVTTIGRLADNDVTINNLGISRYHCKIIRDEGDVFHIEDLGSANGTKVNGVEVNKSPLYKGDEIQIGKHRLIFLIAEKGVAGFFKSEEEQSQDPWAGDRTIVTSLPPSNLPAPPPVQPPPLSAKEPSEEKEVQQEEVSKGKYDHAVFEYVLKGVDYGIKVIFEDKVISVHGLRKKEITIGRNEDNDIMVDNLGVSRVHAKIILRDDQYMIEDNDSANGIKVNGVQVQRSPLYPGDEILIGKHILTFDESKLLLEGVEHGDIRRPAHSESWHTGTYVAMPPTGQPTEERAEPTPEAEAEPEPEAVEEILPWDGKYAVKVTLDDREIASYSLMKKVTCVGRLNENDIVIDNIGVSRLHAKIVIEENGQCRIEDQDSANGFMVNGLPLRRSPLYPGDEIVIVKHKLIFDLAQKAQPTQEAGGGTMSVESWRKESTITVNEADREKIAGQRAERAAREKKEAEEKAKAKAGKELAPKMKPRPKKTEPVAREIIPELITQRKKSLAPPAKDEAKPDPKKFAEDTINLESGGLKRVVKLVSADGTEYKLSKEITVLGKGENADIKVTGKWIKKAHAYIIREGTVTYRLINKGLIVKPTVNGEPVKKVKLEAADIISLGDVTLTFQFEWEE